MDLEFKFENSEAVIIVHMEGGHNFGTSIVEFKLWPTLNLL